MILGLHEGARHPYKYGFCTEICLSYGLLLGSWGMAMAGIYRVPPPDDPRHGSSIVALCLAIRAALLYPT